MIGYITPGVIASPFRVALSKPKNHHLEEITHTCWYFLAQVKRFTLQTSYAKRGVVIMLMTWGLFLTFLRSCRASRPLRIFLMYVSTSLRRSICSTLRSCFLPSVKIKASPHGRDVMMIRSPFRALPLDDVRHELGAVADSCFIQAVQHDTIALWVVVNAVCNGLSLILHQVQSM